VVSPLRPMTFVQSLQGLMKVRLQTWAAANPRFSVATATPDVLLAEVLQADPGDAQIHWRAQAGILLNEACEQNPDAAPPMLVVNALQVWSDKEMGLAGKTALIEGVHEYLIEQIGQLALDAPARPSEPATQETAVAEPVSPILVTPASGVLSDGGLGILRDLGGLEIEKPDELETVLLRHINQQPYAIIAARIKGDDGFGRIAMANQSFYRQFGWNQKGLLRKSVRYLLRKNNNFKLAGLPAAIVTGEFNPTEMNVLRGDGQYSQCTVASLYKRWHELYGITIFTAFKGKTV